MIKAIPAIFALVLALSASSASAHHGPAHGETALPETLRTVGFDQRLGNTVPGDIPFLDEHGREVELGDYLNKGKPVIMTMNYFECPTLCPVQLDSLMSTLDGVKYEVGEEFEVVTVSVDPKETPAQALEAEERLDRRSTKAQLAAGWHFLTGSQGAIRKLAENLGVGYVYDPRTREYAHPAGVIMLTPAGKISRYLFGVDYSPRDIQLGLLDSSQGRIGSVLDKVLIRCYRFDPTTGRYGSVALDAMRLGGIVTMLALGTFTGIMWRRDVQRNRREAGQPAGEGT